jgi:type IV pilus assembly protein PilV
VVILSFALLGAAGLHVVSLRSSHGSFVRGQAVALASDMVDRMRANPRALLDDNRNYVGLYNAADTVNYQPMADNKCARTDHNSAKKCTVAEMAAYDALEWGESLSQRLPAGQGTVCIDSTPNDGSPLAPACDNIGNVYAIKLWWLESEQRGVRTKFYVLPYRP